MLRSRRLQQHDEDPGFHVAGEDAVEDLGRGGLVLVAHRRAFRILGRRHREQLHPGRHLVEGRLEAGVVDLHGVHLPRGVRLHGDVGNGAGISVGGRVGHPEEGPFDLIAAEPEVALRLLAHGVQPHLLALPAVLDHGGLRQADHIGVVGPGQPPVGADHQHPHRLHRTPLQEQVAGASRGPPHVADHLGELLHVGLRLLHPLLGFHDTAGSDQLHGAGDLLGGLHRSDATPDLAELCRGHTGATPP